MPDSQELLPSPIGQHADFRCRQPCTFILWILYPKGSRACVSCRMPSAFVRLDKPTNTSLPIRMTSPPSSVAGAASLRNGRNSEIASARLSVSGRRLTDPMRVTTATSSRTTRGSSTNTASGISGCSGSETMRTPMAVRDRSYSRCCSIARPISISCLESHVS